MQTQNQVQDEDQHQDQHQDQHEDQQRSTRRSTAVISYKNLLSSSDMIILLIKSGMWVMSISPLAIMTRRQCTLVHDSTSLIRFVNSMT